MRFNKILVGILYFITYYTSKLRFLEARTYTIKNLTEELKSLLLNC